MMQMYTLGHLVDLKQVLKDDGLDALEQTVANNIHDLLAVQYDKWGFENDLKVASIANIILQVAPENPVARHLAELALKVSLRGIAARAVSSLMDAPFIAQMVQEKHNPDDSPTTPTQPALPAGGELAGVQDERLITQIIAAKLAESARHTNSSLQSGWATAYNVQGASGVVKNLVEMKAGRATSIHPEVLTEVVQARYRLDKAKNSAFAKYFAPMDNNEALLFNAQGAPAVQLNGAWQVEEAQIASDIKHEVSRLPAMSYQGTKATVSSTCKKGCDYDKPLTKERLNHTASVKVNGKLITVDRMQLFKRIAYDWDKAINPAYMTSWMNKHGVVEDGSLKMQGKDLVPKAVPYTSVYESGAYRYDPHYNSQAAVGVIEVLATEVQQKRPTAITYPVTREACKYDDGYKCLRCGKTDLRKKHINMYVPKQLPADCPHNLEGLDESILWAMSYVCGVCADQLKAGRERTIGKWVREQRTQENVPSAEQQALDNYERYYIQADDQLQKAKRDLIATELVMNQLKTVPEALQKTLETLKFNVQTAEGAVMHMGAKVREQEIKISNLKSTKATILVGPKLPAVVKSTNVPAKIIPLYSKRLTRKERRLNVSRAL